MEMIQTVKKMEKEAIKSSGIDFIRLGSALFGAYMAMNIGANDVANNVGPAVGSKALTLGGAIVIAAIFFMIRGIVL